MKEAPRIKLARLPTPLVPLDRLSGELGGPRIWLKRDDLTETAASGNKLRKLEYSVAQALAEGATTLITCGGVQSNHCRVTAIVAAQLGLKCQLLLRGQPEDPDGNLMLDRLVGAEVRFLTMDEWRRVDEIFAEEAERWRSLDETPFCIPTGASDEIGLWGYVNATRELANDFSQLGIEPDYIVSATGSGGTLGGLIVGRALHGLGSQVVAFNVCDDEAYFINKISADIASWERRYEHQLDPSNLPINVIDGHVGPGYGEAAPHVYDTIRRVARLEGVVFDPVYTGKAFDALLTELNRGQFTDSEDIVFLHTGGIFGLFPHRQQL